PRTGRNGADVGGDASPRLGRHVPRAEKALQSFEFEWRISRLDRGRNLRCDRGAVLVGDREDSNLACARQRELDQQAGHHDVDTSGYEILNRETAIAIIDLNHVETRALDEARQQNRERAAEE